MISISLVDFIGKIKDGVGVILSFEIDGKYYEMMYWFNPNDKHTVVIEDQFYIDYPLVLDIMKFEKIDVILKYIHAHVLPPRQEIFEQFLK